MYFIIGEDYGEHELLATATSSQEVDMRLKEIDIKPYRNQVMKCQIHKYRRIRSSKNKHDVYKCVSCPHYVIGDLVIGREAICWYCGNVFQMSKLSLLLKPHCGCKTSVTFSKVSKGAGMDDLKIKILEKRSKETSSSDNPAKSALLDHLLSKLPK